MTRNAQFDRNAVARILLAQDGVISRAQASASAMSEAALRHRIRPGGSWQLLLPGIYLAQTGRPDTRQREMGAILYGGPGSFITGSAALAHHGIAAPDTGFVDVMVPAMRRRRDIAFVRAYRTTRMPDVDYLFGQVRCAPPVRALADAARGLQDLATVRAIVADAVQRRKVYIVQLAEELAAGPVQGTARLREVLREVSDGVRSAAESDLRTLIRRAGLPEPMYNPHLYAGERFIGIPDAWWPAACVAAEVESRAWHLSPADWEQTLIRDARMSACGIVVLHFSPQRLRTQARDVTAEIRSALRSGRPGAAGRIRAVPAA